MDADGKCLRTPRPDVHKSLRFHRRSSAQLGFVIALPEQPADGTRAIVSFDGYEQVRAVDDGRADERRHRARSPGCWSTLAMRCGNLLVELRSDRSCNGSIVRNSARRSASQTQVVVESAFNIAGRSLLVIGWAADPSEEIRSGQLQLGRASDRCQSSLVRVQRPGLFRQLPIWRRIHLGFFFLVDTPELANSTDLALELETAQGCQSVTIRRRGRGMARRSVPKLKGESEPR